MPWCCCTGEMAQRRLINKVYSQSRCRTQCDIKKKKFTDKNLENGEAGKGEPQHSEETLYCINGCPQIMTQS